MALAAFLASISTSIAGTATSNETITIVGLICGILSMGIYAFAEAWVDGKSVSANTTNTTKTVTATSNDKILVQKVIDKEAQ